MSTDLRDLVDRHWRELEARQASGRHKVRVSELPVDTPRGRLAAAVDYEGHRHVMVPISSRQSVRRGLDGPVLTLRKRPLAGEDSYQTYADLGCLRPDLNDLFTLLCADVLKAVGAAPDQPLKALYRVLDRWKELFHADGALLGVEQLAGLFGELRVLVRLLEKDGGAHRLWHGPLGHRHDFSSGRAAVEVKTSVRAEGRRVRINGLDQLEAPAGGSLQLVWYRLGHDPGRGEDVPGLVERALDLCDDESALLNRFSSAGYRSSDAAVYRDVRFSPLEERWYAVNAAFPKLTGNDLAAAGISTAVTDVAYTIDLSGEPPTPLGPDLVDEHLTDMLREP
jgi:hypothetical protein